MNIKNAKNFSTSFNSSKELGFVLGLSAVEMEIILQKKKLIKRLKEERIKKGLSQAEVAEVLNSKQPAIARMESGQVSQVSMDFLLRAALIFGMTVSIKSMKLAA